MNDYPYELLRAEQDEQRRRAARIRLARRARRASGREGNATHPRPRGPQPRLLPAIRNLMMAR